MKHGSPRARLSSHPVATTAITTAITTDTDTATDTVTTIVMANATTTNRRSHKRVTYGV